MAMLEIQFEGSQSDCDDLTRALAEARRTGDARYVGNLICDAVDPGNGSLLKTRERVETATTHWRKL